MTLEAELGRSISLDDIARAHAHDARCACGGRGYFRFPLEQRRPSQLRTTWCVRAIREFARVHLNQFVNEPSGPRWLKRFEPAPPEE